MTIVEVMFFDGTGGGAHPYIGEESEDGFTGKENRGGYNQMV